MSSFDAALLRQLSTNSAPYRDPLARVRWDELSLDEAWLPEQALSLYGTPEFGQLSGSAKRRLSQYEFINVMLCGLWLEGLLLLRLARHLDPAIGRGEYEHLLHEMREETGHSLMFLRAIETSGLPVPDGSWRAPLLSGLLARHLPLTGALFWMAAVIGEHVPDQLNRFVRKSDEPVNAAVRQILSVHIVDEARHIALARGQFERRLNRMNRVQRRVLAPIARALLRELIGVCFFPPAQFYELAGLTPGGAWRRTAMKNPLRRAFIAQCLDPTRRLLLGYGLKIDL